MSNDSNTDGGKWFALNDPALIHIIEAAEFRAEHDLAQPWLWDKWAMRDMAADSCEQVQLAVFGEVAPLMA